MFQAGGAGLQPFQALFFDQRGQEVGNPGQSNVGAGIGNRFQIPFARKATLAQEHRPTEVREGRFREESLPTGLRGKQIDQRAPHFCTGRSRPAAWRFSDPSQLRMLLNDR
jgi:hypothetical protein